MRVTLPRSPATHSVVPSQGAAARIHRPQRRHAVHVQAAKPHRPPTPTPGVKIDMPQTCGDRAFQLGFTLLSGKEFLRNYKADEIAAQHPKLERARTALHKPLVEPDYLKNVQHVTGPLHNWWAVANLESAMSLFALDSLDIATSWRLELGKKHPLVQTRTNRQSGLMVQNARAARSQIIQHAVTALQQYMGTRAVTDATHGLDLGCGTGRTTRLVAELFPSGPRLTGIDVSDEALAWAKTHPTFADRRIDWEHGLIEQLSAADNSQDFVTVFSTLYALPDEVQAQVLAEVYRVLKPRGALAIVDHNIKASSSDQRRNNPWPGYWFAKKSVVRDADAYANGLDKALLQQGFQNIERRAVSQQQDLTLARKP